MEKIVNPNRKDWSLRLTDTLWAYRIAFKTSLGMSPYRIVYEKPCHLPIELEHKAYWTIKIFNLNHEASKLRKLKIIELQEMMHMRILKFINQESKIFMIIKFQEKYLRLVKRL